MYIIDDIFYLPLDRFCAYEISPASASAASSSIEGPQQTTKRTRAHMADHFDCIIKPNLANNTQKPLGGRGQVNLPALILYLDRAAGPLALKKPM